MLLDVLGYFSGIVQGHFENIFSWAIISGRALSCVEPVIAQTLGNLKARSIGASSEDFASAASPTTLAW